MDPADLAGTTWQLVSFDGVAASGLPGLLTFDDAASFSTRDGCYNISGSYIASGDHLTFPSSNVNAHACLQPLEVQTHAASLSNAIGEVAYYLLSADGNELTLTHVDGKTANFIRSTEPPPGDAWSITWLLDSIVAGMDTERPIEGTEITLTIANPALQLNEAQTVTGSSGCNTYQAAMTSGVDTVTFSDITMTDMGCVSPPGIMDQEQRYLELLGEVTSHNVYNAGALQLTTADGTTLIFRPAD